MEILVFLSFLVSLTAAGHPYSGHFNSRTPHLLFGPKTGVFPLKGLNSDIIGPLVLGNKLAAIIVGRDSVANIPKDFSAKGRIELRSETKINKKSEYPRHDCHDTGVPKQFPESEHIKPNQIEKGTKSKTGGMPFQGPMPIQQRIPQLDRTGGMPFNGSMPIQKNIPQLDRTGGLPFYSPMSMQKNIPQLDRTEGLPFYSSMSMQKNIPQLDRTEGLPFYSPMPMQKNIPQLDGTEGLPFYSPMSMQKNIPQLDGINPWAAQLRPETFLGIRHNALTLGQRANIFNLNYGSGPFRTLPTVSRLRRTHNVNSGSIFHRSPSVFTRPLPVFQRQTISTVPYFAAANLRQRSNLGPLSFLRSQLLKLGRLGLRLQLLQLLARPQQIHRQVSIPEFLSEDVYWPVPKRVIPW